MAKEKQTLFVQGRPVTQLPDGGRLQLEAGELSDEHRQLLGDRKIDSLQRSGHLKTQEQIDEEERLRVESNKRAATPEFPNPNYGTPAMTPEAQASNETPADDKAPRTSGNRDWQRTPVGAMGLDQRTVNALLSAKITNAGQIVAYGEKHDGLTDIDGIGEATENEIKTALKKLAE